MALPISVLDVVPVRRGATVKGALDEAVVLARHVEDLGYHRVWYAEHHGTAGIASTSPAVLTARVASLTSTIRVGSGGVMLPNHAPLAVAEQWGTLEAMFPGRIDLGIGRAPGTDPLTTQALGARRGPLAARDFPEQLDELFSFFRGDFDPAHPFSRITATPATGHEPPVFLLGSSDFSARLAGALGLPFSFAHHFSQENTIPALSLYRRSFQPGAVDAPYAIVAALVILADDDATARRNAMPMALAFLKMSQGRHEPFPSLEEVDAWDWQDDEKKFVDDWMNKNIVGSPQTAQKQLQALLASTQASELMALSTAPTVEARLRSYTLLRELVH